MLSASFLLFGISAGETFRVREQHGEPAFEDPEHHECDLIAAKVDAVGILETDSQANDVVKEGQLDLDESLVNGAATKIEGQKVEAVLIPLLLPFPDLLPGVHQVLDEPAARIGVLGPLVDVEQPGGTRIVEGQSDVLIREAKPSKDLLPALDLLVVPGRRVGHHQLPEAGLDLLVSLGALPDEARKHVQDVQRIDVATRPFRVGGQHLPGAHQPLGPQPQAPGVVLGAVAVFLQ